MPTQLSPLHEILFQTWAKAHRIDNHDDPSNSFDHRGVFQRTNGLIHPPGHINQLAAEHNAAAEAQDGGGAAIDPAMAAVEHQKNQSEAQAKEQERQLKVQLLERSHAQKLEIKQMELQHKSMEADKDRAYKAQEAQVGREHEAQRAQADRQATLQDTLMQRQHSLQDQATNQQADMHGKLLTEHLTRTRPQPATPNPGQS